MNNLKIRSNKSLSNSFGQRYLTLRFNDLPSFSFPFDCLSNAFYHVDNFNQAFEKLANSLCDYSSLDFSTAFFIASSFTLTPSFVKRNCFSSFSFVSVPLRNTNWGGHRSRKNKLNVNYPKPIIDKLVSAWNIAVFQAASSFSLSPYFSFVNTWRSLTHHSSSSFPPKYVQNLFASAVSKYQIN